MYAIQTIQHQVFFCNYCQGRQTIHLSLSVMRQKSNQTSGFRAYFWTPGRFTMASKPWCCRRVGACKPNMQTLLESGCKHICTCPGFQLLSSCQWRSGVREVQPPCYRLWCGISWTRKQHSEFTEGTELKKITELPSYTCSLSNHGSHLAFISTPLIKKVS